MLGPGALRVDSNNADKLLTSRQFTRPKSVHATALENDRCKWVYNIYLSQKHTNMGSYLGNQRVENNDTADLTIP